jgi:hypothetical protein
MQTDVTGGGDGNFIVIGSRRGGVTLDNAGQFDVLAGKLQQCAGFQPARFAFDRQCALCGGDLEQCEIRIVLADGAVDHDIVEAGQHNATTRVERREVTGAVGFQADFAGRDLTIGAGVDDDVALGREVALEQDGVAGVDDDVGVTADCLQVAFEDSVTGRVEGHAAGQGFQQAGAGQAHILATARRGAGIHVDGAVGADPAGDGDLAAGRIGHADVDHRTARAGIHARSRDRIRLGPLLALLSAIWVRPSSSALPSATAAMLNSKLLVNISLPSFRRTLTRYGIGVGAGDGLRAGQHAAIVLIEHAVDRRLQIVAQIGQTGLVALRTGGDGDHLFQILVGAEHDAQREAGSLTDIAIGKFGEAVGDQFFRPGWRQHRHVAGSRQGDAAVFLQGS